MSRIVSRWRIIVVVFAGLLGFAGCQQEDKGGPSAQDFTYMRIQPDYNLEALPPDRAYELWVFNIVFLNDTTILPGEFRSLGKFVWDPALYLARDPLDTNIILPLTALSGTHVDVDITNYFGAFLTIEPVPDPDPEFPSGPTLLVAQIDRRNPQLLGLVSPFAFGPIGVPEIDQSYTLVSQSNKKDLFRPTWRDGREGQGIWFCLPQVRELKIEDPEVSYTLYLRRFVDRDSTTEYKIWINSAYPESSFSNFGRIFRNQEPDLNIVDGRFGLEDTAKSLPQVPPWSDSLFVNGDRVYRYISSDGHDTCALNVTRPEFSRCNTDTFQVLVIDTTVQQKRFLTSSDGDTIITPTLVGLPNPDNPQSGGLLLTWEYQAWLIFDNSTALSPEDSIRPLSLGRFSRPFGRDRSNRFTDPDGYDRNFNVPGEDFLVDSALKAHHPSLSAPLDVIRNPRVKKIWVTIEPRQDEFIQFDWAPNDPYTQLILYSAWIPKVRLGGENTFPIVYRDKTPGEESLNENHYWPSMVVYFQPPPQ